MRVEVDIGASDVEASVAARAPGVLEDVVVSVAPVEVDIVVSIAWVEASGSYVYLYCV